MRYVLAVLILLAAGVVGWWSASRTGALSDHTKMPVVAASAATVSSVPNVASSKAPEDAVAPKPEILVKPEAPVDPYQSLTGRPLDQVLEIRPTQASINIPPLPATAKLSWRHQWMKGAEPGAGHIEATGERVGDGASAGLRLSAVIVDGRPLDVTQVEVRFESGVLKVLSDKPLEKTVEWELTNLSRHALFLHGYLPKGSLADGASVSLASETFQLCLRSNGPSILFSTAKLGTKPDRSKPKKPQPDTVPVYPAEPGSLSEIQVQVQDGQLVKVSRVTGKRLSETGDWDLGRLEMSW